MERKSNGLTFSDGLLVDLGGQRTAKLLGQLGAVVPWESLARLIRPLYDNTSKKGGRPNVPVVVMLKITFMQRWFGLSDEPMEEAIDDRLSFRRFLGLSIEDAGVDHATIALFRKRLHEAGLVSELFEKVNAHLLKQGLILREGTVVDATIIEAPRGRTTKDGLGKSKDKAASYTIKHVEKHHGYKAHIAPDTNGMIKDYLFDTAKVHDSKHIDQLAEDETSGGAVYADSAYMNKKRSARLKDKAVHDGIIQRRVRGQDELRPEQKAHNKRCAKIRAIVEMPFAWFKHARGYRTRYRGIKKNASDFGLWAMAHNLWRRLSLKPAT